MSTFGEALGAELKRHGHTQGDVARATGISGAAVCQYISGKREPGLGAVTRLVGLYPRLLAWLKTCAKEQKRAA